MKINITNLGMKIAGLTLAVSAALAVTSTGYAASLSDNDSSLHTLNVLSRKDMSREERIVVRNHLVQQSEAAKRDARKAASAGRPAAPAKPETLTAQVNAKDNRVTHTDSTQDAIDTPTFIETSTTTETPSIPAPAASNTLATDLPIEGPAASPVVAIQGNDADFDKNTGALENDDKDKSLGGRDNEDRGIRTDASNEHKTSSTGGTVHRPHDVQDNVQAGEGVTPSPAPLGQDNITNTIYDVDLMKRAEEAFKLGLIDQKVDRGVMYRKSLANAFVEAYKRLPSMGAMDVDTVQIKENNIPMFTKESFSTLPVATGHLNIVDRTTFALGLQVRVIDLKKSKKAGHEVVCNGGVNTFDGYFHLVLSYNYKGGANDQWLVSVNSHSLVQGKMGPQTVKNCMNSLRTPFRTAQIRQGNNEETTFSGTHNVWQIEAILLLLAKGRIDMPGKNFALELNPETYKNLHEYMQNGTINSAESVLKPINAEFTDAYFQIR